MDEYGDIDYDAMREQLIALANDTAFIEAMLEGEKVILSTGDGELLAINSGKEAVFVWAVDQANKITTFFIADHQFELLKNCVNNPLNE